MANIIVEYTERKEFGLIKGFCIDLYGNVDSAATYLKTIFSTVKPSDQRLAEIMAEYHCSACSVREVWELCEPDPDDLPFP